MKISRLYSNQPTIFPPIKFNNGLSVVLAEIRVPANRDLDTHNLGKTTVGELIDYCLLKSKSKKFFLFKHYNRFSEFCFYLEVELLDGTFLTISRPVNPGSRISFKRNNTSTIFESDWAPEYWDHFNVPFERARLMLDGILGFEALNPWRFRKLIGYLIRSQADYHDVFQLNKFTGKHQDWKPFVAHVLGMRSQPSIDLYHKREELSEITNHLNTLVREWGPDDADSSVIDGLLSVKKRNIEAKIRVLDSFNFDEEDRRNTTNIVEQVEIQISALNEDKYRTLQIIQRLADSLADDSIIFRPNEAEALFHEAGIAFGDQLKRDYTQLVAFNQAISRERREELVRQLEDARHSLSVLDTRLSELNLERARALEFMRESESLAKYKELSREVTDLQSDLKVLEAKREAATRLTSLRREQRILTESLGHVQTLVENEVETVSGNDSSRFGLLRGYFNEIVYSVLGQNAILAIRTNKNGGLEFSAEFVSEAGTATSGGSGTSYKKLLCIAFDLAVLRAHLDVPFPRFVFHDGALEQLEPRKRRNLIEVFKNYATLGIQPIFTALDSDLPDEIGEAQGTISAEDVILNLHDEGDEGRLFKMPPW